MILELGDDVEYAQYDLFGDNNDIVGKRAMVTNYDPNRNKVSIFIYETKGYRLVDPTNLERVT